MESKFDGGAVPPDKVYCLGCRWLDSSARGEEAQCWHPDNVEYADRWLLRERWPKRHPREINANNDCSWYEG